MLRCTVSKTYKKIRNLFSKVMCEVSGAKWAGIFNSLRLVAYWHSDSK